MIHHIFYILFGNLELLRNKKIAIIGSRTPLDISEKYCKVITKKCLEKEYVIVSGMAKGIDILSHETCMSAGKANTILVLRKWYGQKEFLP